MYFLKLFGFHLYVIRPISCPTRPDPTRPDPTRPDPIHVQLWIEIHIFNFCTFIVQQYARDVVDS